MERLSKRDENGNAYYDFGFLNSNHWARGKHVDRLADYEDTGLEPEEINGMVFDNALDIKFGVTIDRLRELAEADRDGRCVVLPCKAGDTVWNVKAVFSYYSEPKEEIVDRLVVSDDGASIICRSGYKFRVDRIGKTVFLTREAAEAALEAHHA